MIFRGVKQVFEEKTQEDLDRLAERRKEAGKRLQDLAVKGRLEKVRRDAINRIWIRR